MKTLLRQTGSRIMRLRERRGISQVALARSAGIARATLVRVEQGATAATLSVLAQIARVLRVEVRDLLPTTKTRRRR